MMIEWMSGARQDLLACVIHRGKSLTILSVMVSVVVYVVTTNQIKCMIANFFNFTVIDLMFQLEFNWSAAMKSSEKLVNA